jgi:hypothetical protein
LRFGGAEVETEGSPEKTLEPDQVRRKFIPMANSKRLNVNKKHRKRLRKLHEKRIQSLAKKKKA